MIERPTHCPNPYCIHGREAPRGSAGRFYRRKGSFARAGEERVARFQCKSCGRWFSEQTFRPSYRLKRPDLDPALLLLRRRGCSIRQAARLLGVHRSTVARRVHRRPLVPPQDPS